MVEVVVAREVSEVGVVHQDERAPAVLASVRPGARSRRRGRRPPRGGGHGATRSGSSLRKTGELNKIYRSR